MLRIVAFTIGNVVVLLRAPVRRLSEYLWLSPLNSTLSSLDSSCSLTRMCNYTHSQNPSVLMSSHSPLRVMHSILCCRLIIHIRVVADNPATDINNMEIENEKTLGDLVFESVHDSYSEVWVIVWTSPMALFIHFDWFQEIQTVLTSI